MANATGVDLLSVVQHTWPLHELQPPCIRTFKLLSDPQFAAKVRDIVGLYIDLSALAVVLSINEKSQSQALDRTRPGLSIKNGRTGTITHNYKGHGTTELFAAVDGRVAGRCVQRDRHQISIRFLNAVEKDIPAAEIMHVNVNESAAYKDLKVINRLATHASS